MTNIQPISSCCQAPLLTEQSDEGTGFYKCSGCKRASDIYIPQESQCKLNVSKYYVNVNQEPSKKGTALDSKTEDLIATREQEESECTCLCHHSTNTWKYDCATKKYICDQCRKPCKPENKATVKQEDGWEKLFS